MVDDGGLMEQQESQEGAETFVKNCPDVINISQVQTISQRRSPKGQADILRYCLDVTLASFCCHIGLLLYIGGYRR